MAISTVDVMTFNVRQMDGDDGEQSWPYRKNALVETLRRCQPALLGTQEIFEEQIDFITDRLPQYSSFGRGRFGDARDKHNRIFYDRARFSLVDTGEFWLSESPEVPGSASWGIPRPRMITWGLLQIAAGPQVVVMNTHLPYGPTGEEARCQSARIVVKKLKTISRDLPVLLMGDFNAPAGGEVYRLLTQHLQDVWVQADGLKGPESTVHGFGKFAGPRIDWILQKGFSKILHVETITSQVDGLFPSDHYPVQARLSWV